MSSQLAAAARRAPAPGPPPRSGARGLVLALALAASIALVFVGRGGVWSHVGGRDTHASFIPRYEAAAAALRELRLPLWNPYEFFGSPLLGSGQGAMLYPPVPILFALLPSRWALQALYVLHFFLFTVATMRYAERHGVAPLYAGLAPLVGLAELFSGIGYNGIDHPSLLWELAWLPVLLLCLDNALERPPARWIAAIAAGSAAQWLAGYPDFALDTAVLLGVAAAMHPDASLARRAIVVVAGLGLGVALAAPQVLALRDALAESVRAEHLQNYRATREAIFGVQSFADLERGPLKLAFLPAAALAVLAFLRPDHTRVFWLVALLWCAFPLNRPFALLYEIPPFSDSRVPAGWALSGGTFLGLLAAAGLAAVLDRRGRALRVPIGALALAIAAYCAFWIARAPTLLRTPAPDYAAVAERARRLRAAADSLDPQARILDAAEIDSGAPLRHRLRSPTGYEPALPPRRAVHLLKDLELHESPGWGRWDGVARHPALAALAGLGVVAVRPEGERALVAAGFTVAGGLPGGDVLLVKPPIPRARLVHHAVVVPDELASLQRLLAHPEDAPTSSIVEQPDAAAGLAVPPPGGVESARIALDLPERTAIDVAAASPGLLVLTDAWAPGWEATLDGRPVELLRADHLFRAVRVPAGPHRIELDYRPRAVRLGVPLAALAAVAIAALAAVGVRRRSGGAARNL